MTDLHVLDMRADRFWMMEKQINRIKSENDLRYVNAYAANISKEAAMTVQDTLLLELGDKFTLQRPKMVKPDPDAKRRLREISR